ncbi:ATP-dependent zinc protease [Laspinema sp. A4]|uniref:ATP-dependent zinc protease family protein n=1 Tax=Laspinema sp. D2d TaxID=2953686 RepID=UPI0021BB9B4F|nr:ATP-dependent zinc protease [Laspinema sp. D2d]MCT7984138.1 ATP-dependent zinc protease [Laspinema sp. D2d]
MKQKPQLPVMGWREWVSLPELGIEKIKAKIDTGARSCAIHAFDIESFNQQGKHLVRFKVHPYQRDSIQTITTVSPLVDARQVRNSGGQAELRLVIVTQLEILGYQWPIELTLTNRDVMGFRMLLGRQALRHRFLVDPGKSFLLSHKSEKNSCPPSG